ncbi:MAG: oligosaccharide flippase family protein [Anaerolineae bacterium]
MGTASARWRAMAMTYLARLRELVGMGAHNGAESNTVRARFLRGAVWSVAGSVVNQGAAFVASLMAARMLGAGGFGELSMVQGSVTTWATVAVLGMNLTATRYLADLASDRSRGGRILGLAYLIAGGFGLVCAVGLLAGAGWLSARVLGEPDLAASLRVGSVLMLVTVVDAVQAGALVGLEAFRALAWTRLAYGIVIVPAMAIGVGLAGVEGAVAGLGLAGAVRAVGGRLVLRRACQEQGIRVELCGAFHEVAVIPRVSLPSALGGILVGLATWLAQVVFAQQPGGYPDLGVFNAALQWRMAILFLPTALGSVLLPLVASQGEESSRRFQVFNQLMAWALVSFMALPLMAFPEAVAWLYGSRFGLEGFSQTMALVMLTAIVLGFSDGLFRVLASRDLLWWGVASNLTRGVLLLVVTFFTRSMGPQGLALAYGIAYVCTMALYLPLYWTRDLVPRDLLFSGEAAITWALTVAVAGFGYLRVAAVWRGLGLGIAITWWVFRVWRLLGVRDLLPGAMRA